MELIYLWVSEYKNIKNQGFNFSPNYDIQHDTETHDLSVQVKSSDLPEDFFGKNISNVTVIVGENGAGKTTIIDCIISLISRVISSDNLVFLIYKNDEKLYCHLRNTEHKSLINFKEGELPIFFQQIGDKIFYYSPHIEGTKLYRDNHSGTSDTYLENYSIYNTLSDVQRQQKELEGTLSYILNSDFIEIKKPEYIFLRLNLNLIDQEHLYLSSILEYKDLLKSINKQINEQDSNAAGFKAYLALLIDIYIKDSNNGFIDFNNNEITNETLEKYTEAIFTKYSIDQTIFEMDNDDYIACISINKYKDEILKLIKILNNYKGRQPIYTYTWGQRTNTIYHQFSSGEALLLKIKVLLSNMIDRCNIIIIDEGEMGMHPEWQRKYVHILLDIINKFAKKPVHLILTTHSPFVLSDIPTQNVLFLKKGDNGLCTVDKKSLTHYEQTFGANIHQLLSQSFFMQNGLIGEFVKKKVEKVIEELSKSSDIDFKLCKQIINLIGEPILKYKLQQMYTQAVLKTQDAKQAEIKYYKQKLQDLGG